MKLRTSDKVLIGSVVVALVWLFVYGFVTAVKDGMNGQNLIGYAMKCKCMEPISKAGYQLYFELFTDLSKRREEMRGALDELGVDADE